MTPQELRQSMLEKSLTAFREAYSDRQEHPNLQQRMLAAARLEEIGFPTPKWEHWKHTDARELMALPVSPAPNEGAGPTLPVAILGECVIVTRNGRVQPQLCVMPQKDGGVSVDVSSKENLQSSEEIRTSHEPFVLLNHMFAEDTVVIRVNVSNVRQSIHVVHLIDTRNQERAAYPRVHIDVQAGNLCVIEQMVGVGENAALVSSLTTSTVASGATLQHVSVQEAQKTTNTLSYLQAHVQEQATFTSFHVALGGNISRAQVVQCLEGKEASGKLHGLYLPQEDQHMDLRTEVLHLSPETMSHQTYKGMIDNEAAAVFNGRIYVAQDAQKTQADQQNSTLLLSEGGKINTKPQLEIFADDVKCTHGATVGALDQDAVFYLKARGLDEKRARQVLMEAFWKEVVEELAVPALQRQLSDRIRQRYES